VGPKAGRKTARKHKSESETDGSRKKERGIKERSL
jgi:hypothetical protein